MFCTRQNKLKLLARNEGKIKSYESCADLRAWSHDQQARDRYIRDWIRSDMPICLIPVCTVSKYLRTMTLRSRGKMIRDLSEITYSTLSCFLLLAFDIYLIYLFVFIDFNKERHYIESTPRCHPNCKSKVVLDSICNSCHAMKECLKNDESFEKYFDDEEFETSHWPCERCLDALKSIKMFWRVITERLFNLNFPKHDDLSSVCTNNESVQSVAKAWEEEIVQQALVVKNLTPFLNNEVNFKPAYSWKSYTKYLKKIITLDSVKYIVEDDDDFNILDKKSNEKKYDCQDKAVETRLNSPSVNRQSSRSLHKKISRSTSVRVKTIDFSGDTCHIDDDEINIYKNDLEYLQQRYNFQTDELNQLKRENLSLKLQLQNMSKISVPSYTPAIISDSSVSVLPKPYESYCDKEEVKNIDSEMIITIKNCENENFKHVSMLQVLHKTNDASANGTFNENRCKKSEDPIKILTKVHNTFGAIVRRELTIANQREYDSKKVKIDASYYKINSTRSVPSCSTVSCQSTVSDTVFVSTTEV